MLTSISNDSIVNAKEVLNRKAYILEVIMMVAILALAIILSRALTRPFNRVTQAINAVKEGFSDETISVPDYVETVHIVDAFNQLLKRMKALDDSRQEFVANVSHELKTPMTSIKVLSDSLLAQENVPAELYREFMEDIASEIDRENQIITDLLALVLEGCTGVCAEENVTEEDMEQVLALLRSFGIASVVPERLMDVVVGVSGSSPAYVFMFIEAMADEAVAAGMPRKQAYEFAAQSVLGSARMVLETGRHPGELKDMVCSPGGTTIQAVKVLEEKGMRAAVMDAMDACIEKSKSM